MYNLHNINDAYKFQERLANARKAKGLTQAALGEKIGVDRQSIANWENGTMPPLPRLVDLCNILETDPNYLLGVSNFPSHKLEAISKEINLSIDNVNKLHNQSFTNIFLDYILSNKQFDDFTFNIKQLCNSTMFNKNLSEILTENAIKKLRKVYKKFYSHSFMNMSQYNFTKCVSEFFDYRNSQTFEQFVKDTFTEKAIIRYAFFSINLSETSDEEKYDIVINRLSQIGFDYEFDRKIKEIYIDKIHRHMSNIIDDFITNETKRMNEHMYIGYL